MPISSAKFRDTTVGLSSRAGGQFSLMRRLLAIAYSLPSTPSGNPAENRDNAISSVEAISDSEHSLFRESARALRKQRTKNLACSPNPKIKKR
jgi:hypothetical protein